MTKAKLSVQKADGQTDVASPASATPIGAKPKRGHKPGDASRSSLGVAVAAIPAPPRQTKAALVRERLAAPGGVSLAALIAATGWQAHTLRATLSGLRKAGLTLTRRREGEDTIYAIVSGGDDVGERGADESETASSDHGPTPDAASSTTESVDTREGASA